MIFRFFVEGRPAPKSALFGRGKVFTSKRERQWRKIVVKTIKGHPAFVSFGKEKVSVEAYFLFKSKKLGLRSETPDIDKLLRSLFDSLVDAGCIEDDSQICEVFAQKANMTEIEGVLVLISNIDDESDNKRANVHKEKM